MTEAKQRNVKYIIFNGKIWNPSIAAIQTDAETREKLRSDYANDTAQLIASANVIAIEFQTIAAANNYWKTEK